MLDPEAQAVLDDLARKAAVQVAPRDAAQKLAQARAMTGAMAHAPQRLAAVVTLTVTASGVAAFGIGAAFWGLLAGLAVLAGEQLRR